MPTPDRRADDHSLTAATTLFNRWRSVRPRGERIPADLWAAACDAARKQGVSRTSQALGLDYYALAARVEEGSAASQAPRRRPPCSDSVEAIASPAFVELPVRSSSLGIPCTIELEHTRADVGATKLRIELPSIAPADLAALVHSWRSQA